MMSHGIVGHQYFEGTLCFLLHVIFSCVSFYPTTSFVWLRTVLSCTVDVTRSVIISHLSRCMYSSIWLCVCVCVCVWSVSLTARCDRCIVRLNFNPFEVMDVLFLELECYLDSLICRRLCSLEHTHIRGLFKKYRDCNCSGCSVGGMCLQPVLTCSYMS